MADLSKAPVLHELLVRHRCEPATDLIVGAAMPCVTLYCDSNDEGTGVGCSRMGGVPDLPVGTDWPAFEGERAAFVMQLNLGELPSLPGSPLPAEGLLSFFIWDGEDGSGDVLYLPGAPAPFRTAESPSPEQYHFMAAEQFLDLQPHRVFGVVGLDLPAYGTPGYDAIGERVELADYDGLADEVRGGVTGDRCVGQLLGRPYGIDRHRGEDVCTAIAGYGNPRAEARAGSSEDWVQFWRIDSNYDVGFSVWDAGSIHLMIRSVDFANRDFGFVQPCIESA